MKKLTLKSVKAKAWKAFSLYIRKKDMDSQGFVECYTCGVRKFYKEMQVGHWIEGHSNAVYINENYVRVQCPSCNLFHGGRQGEFRDKIRKELGDKRVNQLILEANQVKLLTIENYLELEKIYKTKLEKL